MTHHSRRRSRLVVSASLAAALGAAAITAVPAAATPETARATKQRTPLFGHTGTFFLQDNVSPGQATSAEILAFSKNGSKLLYTDALTGDLGVVDVRDPRDPRPRGFIDLTGDPTSVAVHGRHALVAVVTSEDPDGAGPLNELDAPTGELLVIHLRKRKVVRTIALGGQPDSVALAPSGRFAAIVIENERDEDENDGLLPQAPAGKLQVLRLEGAPAGWRLRNVRLTGLATTAGADPEPEFVDINAADKAVVTLQENNHLAIVDLASRTVVRHFSAGTTDVADVDTVEEEVGPQGSGLIVLDGSLSDRRREPDTVQWVDENTFAIANEGDYEDAEGVEGGSRSFTLFHASGRVEYESGSSFEHHVVRAGHYPEGRSENKGAEPEGLEVARHGGRTFLFVASERANVVGVYRVTKKGRPVFQQLLPTGIGPEGLVFRDGLLAVSAEEDGLAEGFSARPFITLFELTKRNRAAYPQLVSDNEAGLPIPWVAQSGLAGDPRAAATMWSVSDSFLGQAYLYRLDVSRRPARIVERVAVGGYDVTDQLTGDFDLEGVAVRPEGGFWLASEGRTNAGSSRPNLLLRTDDAGTVLDAVELPGSLAAQATSSGFEGVAVTGTAAGGDEVVYVAVQREWKDDAAGRVKIGRYDVAGDSWTFAAYPLDDVTLPAGGWVGLSELTLLADGTVAVVERDNQLGLEAAHKKVYVIDPESVEFAAHGEALPLLSKSLRHDLLPVLDAASVSVPDKVEGLGLTADGRLFAVTDNDGVDENYGETVFVRVD